MRNTKKYARHNNFIEFIVFLDPNYFEKKNYDYQKKSARNEN